MFVLLFFNFALSSLSWCLCYLKLVSTILVLVFQMYLDQLLLVVLYNMCTCLVLLCPAQSFCHAHIAISFRLPKTRGLLYYWSMRTKIEINA